MRLRIVISLRVAEPALLSREVPHLKAPRGFFQDHSSASQAVVLFLHLFWFDRVQHDFVDVLPLRRYPGMPL